MIHKHSLYINHLWFYVETSQMNKIFQGKRAKLSHAKFKSLIVTVRQNIRAERRSMFKIMISLNVTTQNMIVESKIQVLKIYEGKDFAIAYSSGQA